MNGEPDSCPRCDTATPPEPIQSRDGEVVLFCPTCGLDMSQPPRNGSSRKDCPQCGQGVSKKTWARIRWSAKSSINTIKHLVIELH